MSLQDAIGSLLDKDFDGAIGSLTAIVEAEGETAPTVLSYRAEAFLAVHEYAKALADADACCAAVDSPVAVHLLRKGRAEFFLERVGAAKASFNAAAGAGGAEKLQGELTKWHRRCDAVLAASPAAPSNDPSAQPANPKENEPEPKVEPTQEEGQGAGAPAMRRPRNYERKRFDWFQDPTCVTITIYTRGRDAAASSVSLSEDRKTLELVLRPAGPKEAGAATAAAAAGGGGDEDDVHMEFNLFEAVADQEPAVCFRRANVEVTLQKQQNYSWPSLEPVEDAVRPAQGADAATIAAAVDTAAAGAAVASYPSSHVPRKPRDWDALESAVEAEANEETADGDSALTKLFRDIYAKADPETRRAMNKSFQSSGGTVLSTNWKEVGQKDYEKEREAPNGMEWKRWG